MIGVLAVLFFAVAIGFSMLGQGGGVLYTPLQVWSGVNFHTAATTSLFLIMTMSLSSSIVFRKAKRIDWPLALVLESATTLGGFLGGFYSARFSGAWLSVFFSLFVAVAGFFMVRSFQARHPSRPSAWTVWQRTLGNQSYAVDLSLGLPVSLVAGLISGMVGVGGGILKVPMMVLLLGIPMDIAVGSSALMVGLTATGGFAGHLANGHWDWRTSLLLAGAVFFGGQIGSRVSVKANKELLKQGFGWFLLAIAALMLVKAILAAG